MHSLKVEGVLYSIKDKQLLTDIYLECETNSKIAIIGRNGSGKTTLFKIISGFIVNENSCISIDNKKIIKNRYREIAFCPQDMVLLNDLSLLELLKVLYNEKKSLINIFLEDEFLEGKFHQKIKYLSSGERKYIQVKIYLNSKHKFLILDEPFSHISPVLSDKLIKLINNCKDKGIILSDHIYDYIYKITDKVYLLENGVLKKKSII